MKDKTKADRSKKGSGEPKKKLDLSPCPVQKNEHYELDITGLTSEGAGVGRIHTEGSEHGFAIFIEGALPGERVKIQIVKVQKTYGYGKLLEVLTPSEDRVAPACPVAAKCGGCSLQHLKYSAQLRIKHQQVVDALRKLGDFQEELEDEEFIVEPTLGMEDPWRYRNKSQVPFSVDRDGKILHGFYRSGTHEVVPNEGCLIQDQIADQVVGIVSGFAQENGISIYDEERRTGLLRHVMTRVGKKTGEVMVVLVVNGRELPQEEKLVEALLIGLKKTSQLPIFSLESIILNTNTKATNVILGPHNRTLYGKNFITDKIGKFTFKISPFSFFQVNTIQTNVLYEKALEYADLKGGETVIDAYCGAGTISLFLSQKAKKVIGVEIVEPAVADAAENAKRNGVENVKFHCGEAEHIIPELYKKGVRADVVVVDPPRKGCDVKLLETIVAMEPDRMVYVSCDPSTLARDLRYLADRGFRVEKVQPVDMFPGTGHVEAVILMMKCGSDTKK